MGFRSLGGHNLGKETYALILCGIENDEIGSRQFSVGNLFLPVWSFFLCFYWPYSDEISKDGEGGITNCCEVEMILCKLL